MRRILPVCIALFLLLLPSCTPSDNFSAGQPLTKDELAALSSELFTQGEEPVSEADTAPKYTDREPNTVYWTKNGSVYHKYRDCYYLQNAESVKSGTVLTARTNGKERACSECGDE